MKVRVKFVGEMHKKFGMEDLWLSLHDKAAVKDVLAKLEMEKGVKIDLGDPSLVVLVNGRRIEFMGGSNASLKDMDEIVVMPIIAGG
ncbi:MAG: MoaD/ThiS family protein [Nitrososphaerota archaeon]|nr:MoaD/ThiS family protein [Candidatus Bathyarchaeota archaeon]MDW8024193.1 MoaD/ThiS family protein [Nitrososphaerota archaeon]